MKYICSMYFLLQVTQAMDKINWMTLENILDLLIIWPIIIFAIGRTCWLQEGVLSKDANTSGITTIAIVNAL